MILALLFPVPMLAQTPVPPLAPARPPWIERLPEAVGRLYAMGTADLVPQEGQAITRASDRARLEVVARLRATVKGQTSIATRTTEIQRDGQKTLGTGDRQVRDEVSVGARAEDLPGLVVEQTFTDPGSRTVFALAYLDLAQAGTTLSSRLDRIRQIRTGLGKEVSRKALWKVRKLTLDLDRLEESIALLAYTGAGAQLRPAFLTERTAVNKRMDDLNLVDLPPVDLSRMGMAVRANVDLPLGVETYLKSMVASWGLLPREMNPDLILDLSFTGGAKGSEFIHAEMDIYNGVTYRIEAKLTLTEGSGAPLTRSVPILIVQGDSPDGMVNQFRKQIERWLPRLLGEFKAEMQ